MTIVEMIALVGGITELVKVKIFKGRIEGIRAVILAALASLAVVGYDYVNTQKPFDLGFFWLAAQVFAGSSVGYQLLKNLRKPA